jgi:phenylacetic acid degradation operon negative regulatory protein
MDQESNRALTARSVLASTLLGEDPPELTVAHLVHMASLFGVSENRARVALSRMVAAGEASTDGSGNYRLAGHLLERQVRQAESRTGQADPWTGRWTMAVVRVAGRSAEERAARRHRLDRARLAERREGVWLRPDNLELRPDPAEDSDLEVFVAQPAGDPSRLAAELWDLDGWSRRAEQLEAALADSPTHGPDDLAPGFELSASVLRHLQADPLLPAELLPPGWPGTALRHAYSRWDNRYREVLRAWGRAR